ncbi:MAG: T9SS C-terminal target domain-containing protein [Pirellulales bacterium]|nr:T9SS C-terminal target domain-containing protein [Pirellulales bacterium]
MIKIRDAGTCDRVLASTALACVLFLASSDRIAAREPLRIDLGMNTGRNDTAAPGWVEWQVENGAEATREFGAIQITLRATDGAALKGAWYKAGLASGALMATDGVVLDGGAENAALEVEITGLAPGRHSLVTYHNQLGPANQGRIVAAIRDQQSKVEVRPTMRVADDVDSESAFLEFTASAGAPVVLRIAGSDNGAHGDVTLNGLEIDAVNPKAKAVKPSPADQDGHADGESGVVALAWRPSKTAVKHELYAATHADPHQAFIATASADKRAGSYRGEVANDHADLKVDPKSSLLYHCWRVDSTDADGTTTRGDVWTFRVRHLAFPGAEGYGRFAVGGRGGRVIKVANLNDSGPGSLRAAVEADEPRTVVFDVSGRIILKSRMILRNPFITIAGHSAPGEGICISNYNLGMLGCHDAVIRYLRVRPGDPSGETMDGMGMASSDHSIIDHCSISWTQDESFSSRGARNITLQRTLISEALNIAGHKKYEKGKEHGYAASISGDVGSFHHNLLAHCAGRNWSLAGGLDKAGRHAGRLDIRNNVVYNWSHRTTDGGARQVNFVNNYYKPGPATRVFHLLKSEREAVPAFGPQDYYAAGNVMEGRYDGDVASEGVISKPPEPLDAFLFKQPFFEGHVATQSAAEAFDDVLSDVGCNRPALDEHDRRVIEETRAGTTTYRGSVSGHPGLPDSQADVGGWDEYPEVNRPANWDFDDDGLPNVWEADRGLNSHSPQGDFSEANADPDADGYTQLEDYLNSLATPGDN